MAELKYIAIDHLEPHPNNPRKDLGDLTELAESIKANGVLQNLTVVPSLSLMDGHYFILIGHRRHAAAKLAGLTELPCVVVEMDAKEQMQTMLIENMQRSDLTVYEQAQGFQMMLDLGATVEEIAEKSGFSATTVRRRVKMMELDQKKLKEVSARQLTLSDFDTLAQIEDIKERNRCLEKIGTFEFNSSVNWAMKKQDTKKNMPAVKTWLKSIKAKAISRSDTWSNKYESISRYIYIYKWGDAENTPPKKLPAEVFYFIDDDSLRLFKKAEKKKPEKKPPEVLEKEKAIRTAWKALEDSQTVAYDLRKQFIENLTVTSKNREQVLHGAIWAAALEAIEYNSPDRSSLYKFFGISENSYGNKRTEEFSAGVEKLQNDDLAKVVYACFGDDAKSGCTGTGSRMDFPHYQLSIKLNLLYNWLVTLGYGMSSDEMNMLNGGHEAYKSEAVFKEGKSNG